MLQGVPMSSLAPHERGSRLPLPRGFLHSRSTRGRVHERSLASRLVLVLLSAFEHFLISSQIFGSPSASVWAERGVTFCSWEVVSVVSRCVSFVDALADANDELFDICYFGDRFGGL